MSKVWMGVAVLAIALAGCKPAAENAVVANDDAANLVIPPDEDGAEGNAIGNEAAPENATAAVLALPEYQRNQVFVRAIMDAEFRCDGVVKSERVADVQGLPAWRADCKDGLSHVVSVKADGTAIVMSRAD
ncbi:hypothetical protein P1X14_15060 [Sphingomonas sp. AOB5]|uniref:hypothetical protein n=1 Tax=Sphingomonas sp. AOB5 TaxID=3034017 RepID=UPI0023F9DE35|nr:hypothetical protein [Sphingomonas sp. AOB5]MDF7776574.1 hypothetical protein [Sphingomonas sp. AOB5]